MNAINVIAPYKHHGMWVFDDPRVGLVQEPFVAGADTMIDRIVADIPDAEHGFTMIFSTTPFPGHQYGLDWRREESGGNIYYAEKLKLEGWLCTALLRESLEDLARLRQSMGELFFSAQYQQEPIPLAGNLFKAKWFKEYDVAPTYTYKDLLVISIDTAMKGTQLADF